MIKVDKLQRCFSEPCFWEAALLGDGQPGATPQPVVFVPHFSNPRLAGLAILVLVVAAPHHLVRSMMPIAFSSSSRAIFNSAS